MGVSLFHISQILFLNYENLSWTLSGRKSFKWDNFLAYILAWIIYMFLMLGTDEHYEYF